MMRTFLLAIAALLGVAYAAFRRWNRALEAAVALPPAEPRHVVVKLSDHHGTYEPHVPPLMRKIPPRYWS